MAHHAAEPEPTDLDALVPAPAIAVVPHDVGPPCRIEDETGVSDHDRVIAEVGRRARANGNHAAVTDPAVIAAIRRRIARDTRPGCFRSAWRRALRKIHGNGAGA